MVLCVVHGARPMTTETRWAALAARGALGGLACVFVVLSPACEGQPPVACEGDAAACAGEDRPFEALDTGVADGSEARPQCEARAPELALAALRGESSSGWNATTTATTTALEVAPGRWRFRLGERALELESTSPLLHQMSGGLEATLRLDAAALIVRGWAVAIRPASARSPTLLAWSSWKETTLRAVLDRLEGAPSLQYVGEGCVVSDSCGERELLSLLVGPSGALARIPSRSSTTAGAAELVNGPSSLPDPDSRCTDQSAHYAGTLLLP